MRREQPAPGDVIVLLGGRTGRDGCGGATAAPRCTRWRVLGNLRRRGAKGNPPRGAQAPAPVPPAEGDAADQALQRLWRGRRERGHRRAGRRLDIDLDRVPKSTRAWTARSWPFPRARSAWRWVLAAEDADAFIG